jgi:NADPH-dependent glutamate synthase beta subunit-like oxidoreductase
VRSPINILIKKDTCYVCGIYVERCIMEDLRMYLSPCRWACPIHMNCQGYIRLIAQGKAEEAVKEMPKDLPFAGIIGRICSHPCEGKCERRKLDNQAVNIRALKRYLADSYSEITHKSAKLLKESGKKVAIIGSGPSGLMASYEEAAKGHSVTGFEAAPEQGGLLRWGLRF